MDWMRRVRGHSRRDRRRRRLLREAGVCAGCGHAWSEHPGAWPEIGETCSECQFEIDHGQQAVREPGCSLPCPLITMAAVQTLTELAEQAAASGASVSPPVSDDQVAIAELEAWIEDVLSSHRISGNWDLERLRADLDVSSHIDELSERVDRVVAQEQGRRLSGRKVTRFVGVSTVPGRGVRAVTGPYEFFTSDNVRVFLHDTEFLGIKQENGSAQFYFQYDPQWLPEGRDGTPVVVLTFYDVRMDQARLHEGPASGPEGQVDSFDWDGFDGFTLDTGLMRLPFTSARMSAHLVREPPGSLHPRPGNS